MNWKALLYTILTILGFMTILGSVVLVSTVFGPEAFGIALFSIAIIGMGFMFYTAFDQ